MAIGFVATITLTITVLLEEMTSLVTLVTVAMLSIFVPLVTEGFTVASNVIAPVPFSAIRGKVTVRVLPVPPQVPPPVDEQDRNVNSAGRLSVTTTLLAICGPLLVTV